jgi:DNA-binding response OmpR family regulator
MKARFRSNFKQTGYGGKKMEARSKILVVDDEKHICHNVEKILTKNNYEVTHALSAREALEKMTKESFSLLISDIVMPGQNGLELLKLAKKEWPLTKAIMMTAYASTETALKAIRLGALDYIPKPFTPDELRASVENALSGKLTEAPTTVEERETIDIIDIDIPFETDEVAKYTGDEYAKMLGRSDMPVVEVKMPESLENFCEVGDMVCDIFKKLGATCKAGTKTSECPQKKAKKGKAAKKSKDQEFDASKLIGIDQPFDYEAVTAVTGPEYVRNLHHEDILVKPYEELKNEFARIMEEPVLQAPADQQVKQEPAFKNILVIDDEVAVNNNIRKILAKKGYHVDQAVTKDDALEKIQASPYKLVLLDLRIPGVRGLELLKALRDHHPETKVIIITGYASIETAVEAARLGAIDYLAKPFTPDEIRDATAKALQLAA